MSDAGHKETDDLLEEMEEKLRKEYRQAVKETQAKAEDYFKRFAAKDEKWRARVEAGEVTEKEWLEWRKGQFLVGQRWEEMRDTLAQDYHNANVMARSVVNGYMPEVYALNHNYATFQVEKGSKLDTSYTLYDRQTVERIARDNPEILPPPGKNMKAKIAANKDIAWQEGQIQSATMQAILQGESIDGMAKRICRDLGNTDYASAVRYARTATTGAECAGRRDAYQRAQGMGIPVKQTWVATLDGRTRHSHRELDGETVGLNEEFSNGCAYPGDPSGPPEEVWNCRCTTIAQIEGFERDVTDTDLRHNERLGDMSYEEWKGEHEKAEEVQEQPAAPEKSWKDKVADVQDRIAKNGGVITAADLHEAGGALADEYGKLEQQLMEQEAAATAKADKIMEDIKANKAELSRVSDEMDEQWNKWRKGEISREEYEAQRDRLNNEYDELSKKNRELRDKWSVAASGARRNQDEDIEWLTNKISEVRDVGGRTADMKAHFGNSRSSVRPDIEKAYSHYPAAWVSQSVDFGEIQPRQVSRGYYAHRTSYPSDMAISGYSKDSRIGTAFHELGHRFEAINSGILDAEKEFYEKRTAGETLAWLGKGYGRDEKTRKDNFLSSYMGKDYGGSAYELVSMGFQYAYTNPRTLAKDRDMQEWIYGILLLE